MKFLSHYLSIGIGFYIGCAVNDAGGFLVSYPASILKGIIIGIIFWPIGLIGSIVIALRI